MKLNPKMLEQAMKRMGVQTQELDAEEVRIKLADKELVIRNPTVVRVNMAGQENFQVSGELTEEQRGLDPADIELVSKQTGASHDAAEAALREADGDIAAAILKLKGR